MKITCAKCKNCVFFTDRKLQRDKNTNLCCFDTGVKETDDACEQYLFNYKNVDIHNPTIKSILKFVRNTDTKDLDLIGNIIMQEQITRKHGFVIGSMYYIKPISSINNYIKVVLLDANDKIAHIQGVVNKNFYGEVNLKSLLPLSILPADYTENNKAYSSIMTKNTDAKYQPTFKRGRKPKKETESLEDKANEFLKENDSDYNDSLIEPVESVETDNEVETDKQKDDYPFDGSFDEENLKDNYNEDEE